MNLFSKIKKGEVIPHNILLSEPEKTTLTEEDSEWLRQRAYKECSNKSSILRKAFKEYKSRIDTLELNKAVQSF